MKIRVYYISGDGVLQELCRTDGGEWRVGRLNESSFNASPTSLLTVSHYEPELAEAKRELKVYYNRPNDSLMWCAWLESSQGEWKSRRINDKY